jgi:hypothetical protein
MSPPTVDEERKSSTAVGLETSLSQGQGHEPRVYAQDQDVDQAIAIVGEHGHVIDPAEEAQVVRKIDLFLVPAMIVGYGLVYYDSKLSTGSSLKLNKH